MTSFRQIEANRRNALRSIGPKTENGKRRSRQNAVRHGLTSETVIVALEDIEDYQAFEAAVIADYDARTAVERELVLRLASLLWRIRRATAIETDLLQIQAEILEDRRYTLQDAAEAEQKLHGVAYRVLRTTTHQDAYKFIGSRGDEQRKQVHDQSDSIEASSDNPATHSRNLTCCFLRLANLDNGVFERLGRYETALWRQILQTLLALRTTRYR
jgi:hypothetical protein